MFCRSRSIYPSPEGARTNTSNGKMSRILNIWPTFKYFPVMLFSTCIIRKSYRSHKARGNDESKIALYRAIRAYFGPLSWPNMVKWQNIRYPSKTLQSLIEKDRWKGKLFVILGWKYLNWLFITLLSNYLRVLSVRWK